MIAEALTWKLRSDLASSKKRVKQHDDCGSPNLEDGVRLILKQQKGLNCMIYAGALTQKLRSNLTSSDKKWLNSIMVVEALT
jgi:hypothetical protein